MDKLKQVFSHHKHKDDAQSTEKSTEKLYEKHPQDLDSAYHMGKGDLGGDHGANVSGLSEASAAGNVYEADNIPQSTGLSTSGTPRTGEAYDRPEGSEAFDTGDPTSAYQGLDATASGMTAHREPRDEIAAYPLEGGRDEFAARDPTSASGVSTAGIGSGLTGTALADRSVDQFGEPGYGSTTGTSTGLGATSGLGDEAVVHSGGSHTTFTGNRLDPNFKEDIPSFHEEFVHGSGSGRGSHDHHHDHHHVRDAAVGGAGAAALGTGAHELGQDESATQTGADYTAPGHYESDPKQHHFRDAAIGGTGIAAVGAGAYELNQSKSGSQTGPASNTIGPHDSNFMNVIDPRVQPDSQKLKAAEEERSSTSGHHYGRDAALVGGAGAVGAGGLYEAEKDRSRNNSNSVFGGTKPTDENIHHGRDQFDQNATVPKRGSVIGETSGGIVAPTASDHHYGRDAALAGGAGAGAVGAGGLYEAEKYDDGNTTNVFGGTKMTDENIHHGRDEFDQGATVPQRGSIIGETSGGIVAPTGAGFDNQDSTEIGPGVDSTRGYAERMPASTGTSGVQDTTGTPEKRHGLSSLLHRSHPNKLHKDPPGGSKHAHAQTLDDGRIVEPRTGLPMNVEKYGSGTGGTDGNSNIAYDESADPAAWDKVKKLNTPY